MIPDVAESLKELPCSKCEDDASANPEYWDVEVRCPVCRMTLGERIEFGTLLTAGPEMKDKIRAFFSEHDSDCCAICRADIHKHVDDCAIQCAEALLNRIGGR